MDDNFKKCAVCHDVICSLVGKHGLKPLSGVSTHIAICNTVAVWVPKSGFYIENLVIMQWCVMCDVMLSSVKMFLILHHKHV